MVSESGLNPSAVEQKYKGSGLVGFMPDTLKGLGFKGTWEDFTKLTGEQQLYYVKRLVNNYTKFNGAPLTSAGQYYTANLWPVALKLPGVRSEDPSTPIIELHPQRSGPGNKYSKKYYDLGYKISADFESQAYKANPLFDKDHKGAITYGDMIKQADAIRGTSTYQKAIADMERTSGYQAEIKGPTMVAKKEAPPTPKLTDSTMDRVQSLLTRFLSALAADFTSAHFHKKSEYKRYLPEHTFLIKINASTNDNTDALEFARVMCTALDEELMAEGIIHTDGQNTEIQCSINGPKYLCQDAMLQLCESLSESFEEATKKIGGIQISSIIVPNAISNYQELNIKLAELNYTLFHAKFAKDLND